MINVLVADDHAIVRSSLTELFASTPDIATIAECADGSEVVERAGATRPDVILMDLTMPGMDGMTATQALLLVQPEARVVVLTASFGPDVVQQAQACGARGFLLKGEDPAGLLESVRQVAAGGTAWCEAAARVLQASI
jgi:DNA-binding NarL/FixJ family response regulator